jgi:hypothetical protein
MPFGKHKGVHLRKVPAQHLVSIRRNQTTWTWTTRNHPRLAAYIERAWSVLLSEIRKK